MEYTPISETQAQKDMQDAKNRLLPWPSGKYSFEISSANDAGRTKINAEGKSYPMIVLSLNVYNDDGRVKAMKDWLILGGQMAYKFRHAAIACGLGNDYENGTLSPDMFNRKRGELMLTVGKAQPKKDSNGVVIPGQFWDPKNDVEDYITEGVTQQAALDTEGLSDEIPF